jgi:hypothetical protein
MFHIIPQLSYLFNSEYTFGSPLISLIFNSLFSSFSLFFNSSSSFWFVFSSFLIFSTFSSFLSSFLSSFFSIFFSHHVSSLLEELFSVQVVTLLSFFKDSDAFEGEEALCQLQTIFLKSFIAVEIFALLAFGSLRTVLALATAFSRFLLSVSDNIKEWLLSLFSAFVSSFLKFVLSISFTFTTLSTIFSFHFESTTLYFTL